MKLTTLLFVLYVVAAGGCAEHRHMSAADWKAANESCKEHGGAMNLLPANAADREFTAVCDDGRPVVVAVL